MVKDKLIDTIYAKAWEATSIAETMEECVIILECAKQKAIVAILLDAIKQSQTVLAEYIVPDSGISEADVVNQLLRILDDRNLVVLMNEVSAEQVSDTTMLNDEQAQGQRSDCFVPRNDGDLVSRNDGSNQQINLQK